MGAGKTIAALAVAERENARRILVICPAMVRAQWVREAQRHLPHLTAAAIEVGASSAKASKAALARRTLAMSADVQVTSYDLIYSLPRLGWDFIIVDEFHALRSVSSKQSQHIRTFFRHNPDVPALGLSGTPIPNEAKQLWNPVDTFFPGAWGAQTRPGYEPYSFVNRFCQKEVNEYGTKFHGLREERREELAFKFGKISDRVVQADFAEYLPPLYVEPLEVSAKVAPVTIAKQWLDALGEEARHIGIYCHLRETARAIHASLPNSVYIDGSLPTSERDNYLGHARDQDRSIIVGTTHALAEGISLSFQKAALVVEWTSDVSNVVQFLGRFSRQDSTSMAPTRVNIAIGPNDVSAAETIRERVANINHVIRASRSTQVAVDAFAAPEMSDDDFFEQLQSIAVAHERRNRLWSAEEDDDAEES
jgi:superfamily II DNA or RNA helicase